MGTPMLLTMAAGVPLNLKCNAHEKDKDEQTLTHKILDYTIHMSQTFTEMLYSCVPQGIGKHKQLF